MRPGARHDFHQLHHVGGTEEMHAHHVRGAADRSGSDRIDIQRRRIRRQHRSIPAYTSQLFEEAALDVQVLVSGLDHKISAREALERIDESDPLHRSVGACCR